MERHVKYGNMEYTYKYPRPAVTADCVVIANEKTPKVLLIQRGKEPYKDRWAFPGGFMNMDETTEVCAFRELMEETGLKVEDLKEIGAYSKVDRDPRGRTITVAYLAIVDKATKVKGQDDAAEAEWFAVDSLPPLAFDHDDILLDALALFYKVKENMKPDKELDVNDKAEIMVESMLNAMLNKQEQLGDYSAAVAAFAVSRLYSGVLLGACKSYKDPEKIIKIYCKLLSTAIDLAGGEEVAKLRDEIVSMTEEIIMQNNEEIRALRKEIELTRQKYFADKYKKNDKGDLN